VKHLSLTRWKTVTATAATAAVAAGAFGMSAAISSPAQPEPIQLTAFDDLGTAVDEPSGPSTVGDSVSSMDSLDSPDSIDSPGSNDS
jgi:hypothetical protein